jgi:aspartate/tyrosine/aromatic aminotransferase
MLESLERVPPDPILGVSAAFAQDPSPDKIDLGVGVYKDEAGRTPVPRAVRAAESAMLAAQSTKSYLSPVGNPQFNQRVAELVLGDGLGGRRTDLSLAQAPGGSGALRLGAALLTAASPQVAMHVSDPTWANHIPLLGSAGIPLSRYPYYDPTTHRVRFAELCDYLNTLPAGAVVLLHACCHNPTGQDLDLSQWQQIAEILVHRGLLPFLDIAYQGLGENLQADRASIQLLAKRVPEMIVAISCSKNFGLYRERTGLLLVASENAERASIISGQLGRLARTLWSMPPDHGAAIVAHLLGDPALRSDWQGELAHMAGRINDLRRALADTLSQKTQQDFSWIAAQRGMFSKLPLDAGQVRAAREQHHIYMAPDGRINIAGASNENMSRLTEGLAAVMA